VKTVRRDESPAAIAAAELAEAEHQLRDLGIPIHGPEDDDPLDQSGRAVRGLPVEMPANSCPGGLWCRCPQSTPCPVSTLDGGQ